MHLIRECFVQCDLVLRWRYYLKRVFFAQRCCTKEREREREREEEKNVLFKIGERKGKKIVARSSSLLTLGMTI